MEHDLELIIARLEILEIEVCNFSRILEILEICFSIFRISWKYWKSVFLLIFVIFTKKTRAEISRRMVRFSRRDLSYETDSGPKTKTVSAPNLTLILSFI